jgi:transcriptional regulator with XRE-family HTH domain
MRHDRDWTQNELGQRTGMAQETISQLESPSYGRFTLRTLKRLASAFDVALMVKFVPFSRLAGWETELSPEDLAVPSFDNDPGFRDSVDVP